MEDSEFYDPQLILVDMALPEGERGMRWFRRRAQSLCNRGYKPLKRNDNMTGAGRKKKTRKKKGGRKCPPDIETIKGPEKLIEGNWYLFQPNFYRVLNFQGVYSQWVPWGYFEQNRTTCQEGRYIQQQEDFYIFKDKHSDTLEWKVISNGMKIWEKEAERNYQGLKRLPGAGGGKRKKKTRKKRGGEKSKKIKKLTKIFQQYPKIFPSGYFRFLAARLENHINKNTLWYRNGVVLTWIKYQKTVKKNDKCIIKPGDVKLDQIVNKNQGNGAAKKVVMQFLKKFEKNRIWLEVRANNKRAIRFYRKNGFKKVCNIKFGEIKGIMMVKN